MVCTNPQDKSTPKQKKWEDHQTAPADGPLQFQPGPQWAKAPEPETPNYAQRKQRQGLRLNTPIPK